MNHLVTASPSTMAAALQAAGIKPYAFDLITRLTLIASTQLRDRVLSRLAFACDAYVNIAIQSELSRMRTASEVEVAEKAEQPRWETYQQFLEYAAGLAASEELMLEAGMQVTPLRHQVQTLFNCRTQVHGFLATTVMPSAYEIPSITDWMRNPRMRRDDVDTVRKLQAAVKMRATDYDTGVINAELEHELLRSLDLKRAANKQQQLVWDKARGELSATLFDALKIRDDMLDAARITSGDLRSNELSGDAIDALVNDKEFVESTVEPFLDLDARTQYKLLTGSERYINDTLIDMVDDRKISFEEHAAATIESRPLLKEVKVAQAHPRFAEFIGN